MRRSKRHLSQAVVRVLFVTSVVLFVVGVYGHLRLGNTWPDSLFKSLQLFHLHYHPHPVAQEAGHGGQHGLAQGGPGALEVNWAIELARFGCALWGLSILPLVIGFLFERRVRQWWVDRRWRDHYVVCGTCSRTRALVRDLCSGVAKGFVAGSRRVVWVGRCPEGEPVLPRGVFWIDGDSGDAAVLARTAVTRAAYLVALHEDDRLNLETIVAAGELCRNRPEGMDPLDAYAHVTDTSLEHSLHELIESGEGFAGPQVREHLFNYYELIARFMARQFPIPPTLAEAPPLPEHVILVGFAAFGQCAALRIMQMSQQLYRAKTPQGIQWEVAKPRITVVDPEAETRLAEFERRHSAFRQFCDLDICAVSTTDPGFCEMACLKDRVDGEQKTLVFCIETEEETMRVLGLIAHMAAEGARSPNLVDRVFIRVARPERLGAVLERINPPDAGPEVTYFASDSAVFKADVLLNHGLDLLACEIHKAYLSVAEPDRRANNAPPAVSKEWEELSEDDRESNRAAADHLWAKLYTLGYSLAEVPLSEIDPQPQPDEALLREIKGREEDMARAEHYRWMTWRLLRGWRYGDPRDNARKLHPDIRDYDELLETTKEKDRVNIRIIEDLLRQGYLVAKRIDSPGVPQGGIV